MAYLKGAYNLTTDQLSQTETLYQAQLEFEIIGHIRKSYPNLFDKPKWLKE